MSRKAKRRPQTLEEAFLDADPLFAVEALIDESSVGGRWFRLMFAAILEVNSAGPGILLDRYSFREVKAIADEYALIGATRFSSGLQEIMDFVTTRLGDAPTESQIMDLSDDPDFQRLDRTHTLRFEEYRQEMEASLIAHLKAHPEKLK